MTGPCAKQTTTATIISADCRYRFSETNYVNKPQRACPRGDLPTGVGYFLCREVCDQPGHAEINALRAAGEHARGGTMYLQGHTYVCKDCMTAAWKAGIVEIIIGAPPA